MHSTALDEQVRTPEFLWVKGPVDDGLMASSPKQFETAEIEGVDFEGGDQSGDAASPRSSEAGSGVPAESQRKRDDGRKKETGREGDAGRPRSGGAEHKEPHQELERWRAMGYSHSGPIPGIALEDYWIRETLSERRVMWIRSHVLELWACQGAVWELTQSGWSA